MIKCSHHTFSADRLYRHVDEMIVLIILTFVDLIRLPHIERSIHKGSAPMHAVTFSR